MRTEPIAFKRMILGLRTEIRRLQRERVFANSFPEKNFSGLI